jgi:hypothetical protein
MLLSPTMLNRSIGPRDKPREAQMEAATRLFGTEDWKRIYAAYDAGIITAAQARHEWTNLMRWRLEHELGYTYTETIPMRMGKGLEIYEMVFASDHHVGKKIMGHLYRLAAGREPVNLAQSKAAKENRKAATAGEFLLFPHVAEDYLDDESVGEWEPIPVHDPAARAWWDAV